MTTAAEHPLPATRDALATAIDLGIEAAIEAALSPGGAKAILRRVDAVSATLVKEVTRITGYTEPNLGLATTAQLAAELAARLVDPHSALGDYRTV